MFKLKKTLILFAISLVLSTTLFADFESVQELVYEVIAPSHYGTTDLKHLPKGAIIYDEQTAKFVGKAESNGWIDLSQSAINSPWYIDVNMYTSDASVVPLSSSDVTSYLPLTKSLLLLGSPNLDSADVDIACESETASGTTCSTSSETTGIVFDVPVNGVYRVCATFTHWTQLGDGTTDRVTAAFELVQTTDGDLTVDVHGNTKVASVPNTDTSSATGIQEGYNPITLCSNFKLITTERSAIHIAYELDVEGTPSSNAIDTTRTNTRGQPDIHWTVFQLK